MRYLFGFLCVCALGVVPLVGCSETGGEGGNGGTGGSGGTGGMAGSGGSSSDRFEIFRGEEEVSYAATGVSLREEGPERVLFASSVYDDPSWADEEHWYYLWIVFDAETLAELATRQDHPVSGDASWSGSQFWSGLRPEEVSFAGNELHTAAIKKVFFGHYCYGCEANLDGGTQRIEGKARFGVNDAPRLAGTIEVRVDGDVPGANAEYEFYEVRLVFDQSSMATGTDAGTDAGIDAGPDAGTP